jgi:uncharacterized protein YecA (UPF0149 family)
MEEKEWLEYINKKSKYLPPLHRVETCGDVSKRKFYRNETCPCGSGKKIKKCCGTDITYKR